MLTAVVLFNLLQMNDVREKKFLIREFNEKKDMKIVRKLEKKCKIGSRKGVSILTNINMTDPLSRIRFFRLHVMLVAERLENKEIVGLVRGCIRCVENGNVGAYVKLGCILGLRVSPKHRRKGVGLRLVKSIEEWLMRNGAQYSFLAAEKDNVASTNLFSLKCNYLKFSTLVIYVHPVPVALATKNLHNQDIKIEIIHMEQAISLYNDRLQFKGMYPCDIQSILNEKQSLGTWVAYFKDEKWIELESKVKQHETMLEKTPKSWVIFSVWSSCELCKVPKTKNSDWIEFLRATVSHATRNIFSCSRMLRYDSRKRPFGFLFLYGLHGEGVRVGALMKSIWKFVSKLAENSHNCKVVITELGISDPVREHIPCELSMSCIDDIWYVKKLDSVACSRVNLETMETMSSVFVDPRDF